LFREGLALADIAARRGLAAVTIEDHLASAVESGEIAIARLVSLERRAVIEAALEEVGTELLNPVFEHLEGKYEYFEIKLVRAAMAARGSTQKFSGL
jgi:ATP-dependent DNA helicase RecQ